MAKPKRPQKMTDTDELIDAAVNAAAEEHVAKAAPKPKGAAGRKHTVDYPRKGKLHIAIRQETFDRLDLALLAERKKRRPERVDKGLIVEEALAAWMKKKGY